MTGSTNKKQRKSVNHGELAIYHFALAFGTFTDSKKTIRMFARQVDRLMNTTGPEIIDGVCFDLRHPDLSPREWRFTLFQDMIMNRPGFGLDGPERNGPALWFPWFGEYDKESYEDALREYHSSESVRELLAHYKSNMPEPSEAVIRDVISCNLPTVFVQSGDTVRIASVHDDVFGQKFEHPHDVTQKFVNIEVVRADGSLLPVATPFVTNGNHTVAINSIESTTTYLNLMWRIARSYGFDSLEKLRDLPKIDTRDSKATSLGIDLLDILAPFQDVIQDDSDNGKAVETLTRAINKAVMFGFLWSKVEADRSLRPLAEKALDRTDANKKGGQNSGDTRRKKAEIGWKVIAKRMAFDVRKLHPEYSQDRVAKELWLDWDPKACLNRDPSKKIKCPDTPTLKKFISDLEKLGGLPKMQKNPPKKQLPMAAE
jgi:hypothetical protein